ncbi:MAG: DinB family protein [Cyclobacteriaceae bacterium]|nr:DinB family protein [Cyclobacteriaceae bacterium]
MKTSPDPATLPPFYQGYVANVSNMDMMDALRTTIAATDKLIRSIPETKGEYRYAPGKWSVKELLCHMLDAERIFAYRALRFARNDQTELPGFDEQAYAPHANAHSRTLSQLADEFKRLRSSTVDLFESFTPDMLVRSGMANNNLISVINLGYVIAGHEVHHRNILIERYLK